LIFIQEWKLPIVKEFTVNIETELSVVGFKVDKNMIVTVIKETLGGCVLMKI